MKMYKCKLNNKIFINSLNKQFSMNKLYNKILIKMLNRLSLNKLTNKKRNKMKIVK